MKSAEELVGSLAVRETDGFFQGVQQHHTTVASAFAHSIKSLRGDYLMRKLQYILFLSPLLLFVDIAHAGDKEDVLAAWNAVKNAWMAGDIDAARKHMIPEPKTFECEGSLLAPLDFEGAKTAFAAGLKFNVQSLHTDITVYGDAAILTEYQVRQVTPPGGTLINSTERATIVWIKQNGQWKGAHGHSSYLTPTNPE